LRDVALVVADVHIIVVTEFSDVDQEIIVTLSQAVQNKLKQNLDETDNNIFVVHNFKSSTPEEAKGEWEV
jgi:hypothetical protein